LFSSEDVVTLTKNPAMGREHYQNYFPSQVSLNLLVQNLSGCLIQNQSVLMLEVKNLMLDTSKCLQELKGI
jgi:hypothetical protein